MIQERTKSKRITSIDMLRGLVIVLMALDHSRDFFGDMRINPHDAENVSVALYLTRYVTHFCAPTFVFLAGVSAWLYGEKQHDRKQLSWFLFSRGLWLLVLDHTLLYFSYGFTFTAVPWIFLVISAIGVSMMILAALCWLDVKVVGLIGLAIIVGHNLLDPILAENLGPFGWVWHLIHQPGMLSSLGPIPLGLGMEVGYPVLPWFGVMAAGYGFAPIFKMESLRRQRALLAIGTAMTVSFLVLRFLNGYGDPIHWSIIDRDGSIDLVRTAMSFAFCCKYPPSLCFVLMTLGPALIVLSLLERCRESDPVGKVLLTFGRVPLFFYLLHFYLLHAASIVSYWVLRGEPIFAFQAVYAPMRNQPIPDQFGFQGLVGVYIAWIVLLLVLYPLCLWYGQRKRRGRSPLWSYL